MQLKYDGAHLNRAIDAVECAALAGPGTSRRRQCRTEVAHDLTRWRDDQTLVPSPERVPRCEWAGHERAEARLWLRLWLQEIVSEAAPALSAELQAAPPASFWRFCRMRSETSHVILSGL